MPPRAPNLLSLPRRLVRTYSSAIPQQPTWTTRSLLSADAQEEISPSQLSHLLRLSALPQPADAQEEASLLADLHSQLRFVRRIQEVDTSGIEPLRAIRDETSAARDEATLGMKQLGGALEEEVTVGHYQRPRRVRKEVDARDVEDWDPLKNASKTTGRYFVVKSGKDATE
ncbi:related to a-agglutinin core protein AGA1 [Cephalotrichum gorgonifer]|uniref:Related to a-agglutinin core protein AGA1 n=1 Tax=Cephalotrichum gorgonifer TaxID=2041049 RepID=A0AAE8SYD5_9PEZI|nr:related to a-agglutinin core protein AGA1 [Cephalotrichum gorgonifer]